MPVPINSVGNSKAVVTAMLAVNLKQTTSGKTHFICYRITKSLSGLQNKPLNPFQEAFLQSLSKMNFDVASNFTITDRKDFVVLFSDSPDSQNPQEKLDYGFTLRTFATTSWQNVSMFLHSAKLLEEQCAKDAVSTVFQVLLNRTRPSSDAPIAKTNSLPILEIRGGPFEP